MFKTSQCSALKIAAWLTVFVFSTEQILQAAPLDFQNTSPNQETRAATVPISEISKDPLSVSASVPSQDTDLEFLQSENPITPSFAASSITLQSISPNHSSDDAWQTVSAGGIFPSGWQAEGNILKSEPNAGLRLTGDGNYKSFSSPLEDIHSLPSYRIDFKTSAIDLEFHVSVDNGEKQRPDPGQPDLYRRLGIYRGEYLKTGAPFMTKVFVLQVKDGTGWHVSNLTEIPYVENKEYTAEFVTKKDGTMEFYLYEKGAARPNQPQGIYSQKDLTQIHYVSWVANGHSATITQIQTKSKLLTEETFYSDGSVAAVVLNGGQKIIYSNDTDHSVQMVPKIGEGPAWTIPQPSPPISDPTGVLRVKSSNDVEIVVQNGVQKEFVTATGIRITDFQLKTQTSDPASKQDFKSAWIQYPDGSKEFILDGKILRRILANGAIDDFLPSGRIAREILKSDVLHYIYNKNSKDEIIQTLVVSEQTKAEIIYDELGLLKSVSDASGKKIIYDRIQKTEGFEINLNRGLSTSAEDKTLIQAFYGLNHQTQWLKFKDGTQINFDDKGRIAQIINPKGETATYQYLVENGFVDGLNVISSGQTFHYDSTGFLSEIQTQTGTIVRQPTDSSSEIDADLNLKDVGDLSGLQVDDSGIILNGELKLKDGTTQIYQDGKVVGFVTEDGRRYGLNQPTVLRLTGDGKTYEPHLFSPLVDATLKPSYQINFRTGSVNSLLHVAVDNGEEARLDRIHPEIYHRLGIYEANGKFFLQIADGSANWSISELDTAFQENTEYTAEFITNSDGSISFYLYRLGTDRPEKVTAIYSKANFGKIRYASWILNGGAIFSDIQFKTADSEWKKILHPVFKPLPTAWDILGGSYPEDGTFQLSGNGKTYDPHLFSPLVASSLKPSYQIDFKAGNINSSLHVAIDNGEERRLDLAHPELYHRLGIYEASGKFYSQIADGNGGWKTAELGVAFKVNAEYTAEFIFTAAGNIELYLYEKGKSRPFEPIANYDKKDFGKIRYASWILNGSAIFSDIQMKTIDSEWQKIRQPILKPLPSTWDTVGGSYPQDGIFQLSGNGKNYEPHLFSSLVNAALRPSYQIDFKTGAANSILHVAIDNGEERRLDLAHPELYHRLGIYEASGKFYSQIADGNGGWKTSELGVVFKENTEYTAEFISNPDGSISFYLYQQGSVRPDQAAAVYTKADFGQIRYASWILNGSVLFSNFQTRLNNPSWEKLLGIDSYQLTSGWGGTGSAIVKDDQTKATLVRWDRSDHSTVFFDQGKINKILMPDQTEITNIIFDQDQQIKSYKQTFFDAKTKEVLAQKYFENNKLKSLKTQNRWVIDYDNEGRAKFIHFDYLYLYRVIYYRNNQGELQTIELKKEPSLIYGGGADSMTFAVDGQLKSILEHGVEAVINAGVIQSLSTQFGTIQNPEFLEKGSIPAKTIVSPVVLPSGTKVYYKNGLPSSFETSTAHYYLHYEIDSTGMIKNIQASLSQDSTAEKVDLLDVLKDPAQMMPLFGGLNPDLFLSQGAFLDSNNPKFGDRALHFPVDYANATLPKTNLNTGASNFTLDFWAKFDKFSNENPIMSQHEDPGNYWVLKLEDNNKIIRFEALKNNEKVLDLQWNVSIPISEWTHVALVRQGSQFSLYINGKRTGIVTANAEVPLLKPALALGYGYSPKAQAYLPMIGSLDELRISDIARWTTNEFTLRSTEYQSDEHTKALFHFNPSPEIKSAWFQDAKEIKAFLDSLTTPLIGTNVLDPSFNPTLSGLTGIAEMIDGSKLTIKNGQLVQAVLTNGTKISYQFGRISVIETANAKFEFDFHENEKNELVGAQVRVTKEGVSETYPLIDYLSNLQEYWEKQLDNYASTHPISLVGNTRIDSEKFRVGSGAATFDGVGDYIKVEDGGSVDFKYGSGDFTIDMWVRPEQLGVKQMLWSQYTGGSTNNNIELYLDSDNHVCFAPESNGDGAPLRRCSSSTLQLGTWVHVALMKDGGQVKWFINGRLEQTIAMSSMPEGNFTLTFGASWRPGDRAEDPFKGQIDEIRITKYEALWKGKNSFEPPQTISDYQTTSNTKLMLHFKEGSGEIESLPEKEVADILFGRDLFDSVNQTNAKAYQEIIRSEVRQVKYSDAVITSTEHSIGDKSVQFAGQGVVQLDNSLEFDLSNADFTVDFRAKRSRRDTAETLVSQGSISKSDQFSWDVSVNADNTVNFNVNVNVSVDGKVVPKLITLNSGPVVISDQGWHHYAMVRKGGKLYAFIDGKLLTTVLVNHYPVRIAEIDDQQVEFIKVNGQIVITTSSLGSQELIHSDAPLTLGASSYKTSFFSGYLDEFRILKGKAEWTEPFSVKQKEAYEPNAQTKLLLHFEDFTLDEAPASIFLPQGFYRPYAKDEIKLFDQSVSGTSQGHEFTSYGDTSISTEQKKVGSGAASFDGQGDFIAVKDGGDEDFQYGDKDFTIDMWVKPEQSGIEQELWSQYAGGSSNNNTNLHLTADHRLEFYAEWGQAGGLGFISKEKVLSGQWTHVALMREGNKLKLFINGKLALVDWYYFIDNGREIQNTQPVLETPINRSMPAGAFVLTFGATYSGSGYIYNFKGQLDEIRITKGEALWKGKNSFEPPQTISDYQTTSNTKLMLHFHDLESQINVPPDFKDYQGQNIQISGSYNQDWQGLVFNTSPVNKGFIGGSYFYTPGRADVFGAWNDYSELAPLQSTVMDLNGDSLPDRIYMETFSNAYTLPTYWWVQFNNGKGFDAPVQWTGVENPFPKKSHGHAIETFPNYSPYWITMLQDINGDKLPDRILQGQAWDSSDNGNFWMVQINNGKGFNSAVKWEGLSEISVYSPNYKSAQYAIRVRNDYKTDPGSTGQLDFDVQELIADLMDLDGDGLPDRVIRGVQGDYSNWQFQKNNGSGFDAAVPWKGVDLTFDSDLATAGSLSWYERSYRTIADVGSLMDMNGDRRPDRLLLKHRIPGDRNSDFVWYIQNNNGKGFDAAEIFAPSVRSVRMLNSNIPHGFGTSLYYLFDEANNERYILADLIDVTGDGLPDRVTVDNNSSNVLQNVWWVEENTGVSCAHAEGQACGFKPAEAWTGIYGNNADEIAIGKDFDHYHHEGQDAAQTYFPYRSPTYVASSAELKDMNGDKIPDRVIFDQAQQKWLIQYGTGKGFLPPQGMSLQGVTIDLGSRSETSQDPAALFPVELYDHLHLTLKTNATAMTGGYVQVTLGSPEEPASYQTWKIENISAEWKESFLPIDQSKARTNRLHVEFVPADTSKFVPSVYLNDLTFVNMRPDESKDWTNFLLTTEKTMKDTVDLRYKNLDDLLGGDFLNAPSSNLPEIDWQTLLGAEKTISFKTIPAVNGSQTTQTKVTSFESFSGSVSHVNEDGTVTTSLPGGTTITFDPPSEEHPLKSKQTVTFSDGTSQTLDLSFGRLRKATRMVDKIDENGNPVLDEQNKPVKVPQELEYTYEFCSGGKPPLYCEGRLDGTEMTVLKVKAGPQTGSKERYIDGRLISQIDASGIEKFHTYDEKGNLVKTQVFYKGLERESYKHETRGDGKNVVILADGTRQEYDANGNVQYEIAPNGFGYIHDEAVAQILSVKETKVIEIEAANGTKFLDENHVPVKIEFPIFELKDDPTGTRTKRVALKDFMSENGSYAEYDEEVLKRLTLKDGTQILFERMDVKETWDEQSQKEIWEESLLDAKVISPDGTTVYFKNGKPEKVVSAQGIVSLFLGEDHGELTNPAQSTDFHVEQAQKLWASTVLSNWKSFRVPNTVVVRSEYDNEGVLISRRFGDGSAEQYEEGRIVATFSRSGELLVAYSYDSKGMLVKIEMKAARRNLEHSVLQLQADLAVDRINALWRVDAQVDTSKITIENEVYRIKLQLESILREIESARQELSQIKVKGKSARNQVADAQRQLDEAQNNVYSQIASLPQLKEKAFRDLEAEAGKVTEKINEVTEKTLIRIEAQRQEVLQSIVLEETFPVITAWYRKYLGRQPSDQEIEEWLGVKLDGSALTGVSSDPQEVTDLCADPSSTPLNLANYKAQCGAKSITDSKYINAQGIFDFAKFQTELKNRPERISRAREIILILTRLRQDLYCYAGMALPNGGSCTSKLDPVKDLLMEPEYLVSISPTEIQTILKNFGGENLPALSGTSLSADISEADKNKINQWLDQEHSLHFGQSAFLALESLLPPEVFKNRRVELSSRAILIDILTAAITDLDQEDLKISFYAMRKTAQILMGTKNAAIPQSYAMDLDTLIAMVLAACPAGSPATCEADIVVLVQNNHYVIVTKVQKVKNDEGVFEDQITFRDPGAGPETSLQMTTVSKEEFLALWSNASALPQSSTLAPKSAWGFVMTTRAPPAAVEGLVPGFRQLSAREEMKVRGAFWGWIKKIFMFVVNLVLKIIEKVRQLITKVLAIVITFFSIVIPGFDWLLSKGISLFGKIGAWFGKTFGKIDPVFGKLAELWNVGHEILQDAFKESQKIIANSRFLRTIKAAVMVVSGIFVIAAGLITGNAAVISVGLTLVSQGTGQLLSIHTNLSPKTIGLIQLGVQALGVLTGGFIAGGSIGSGWALIKTSAPILAKQFAAAGVVAIGNAIGLDPRLTQLISIPVGAVAGGFAKGWANKDALFVGFGKGGEKIFISNPKGVLDYVKESLFSPATLGGMISVSSEIGLNALGVSSGVNQFVSGLLGQLVAGDSGSTGGGGGPGIMGTDIFKKILEGANKLGHGIISAGATVISFGKKILEAGVNLIRQGLGKAVNLFSNIFEKETIEKLTEGGKTTLEERVLKNGHFAQNGDLFSWEVEVGGEKVGVAYLGNSQYVITEGDTVKTFTDLYVDEMGGLAGAGIEIVKNLEEGLFAKESYDFDAENGVSQAKQIKVFRKEDPSKEVFSITPYEGTPLTFDKTTLISGRIRQGDDLDVVVRGGKIEQFKFDPSKLFRGSQESIQNTFTVSSKDGESTLVDLKVNPAAQLPKIDGLDVQPASSQAALDKIKKEILEFLPDAELAQRVIAYIGSNPALAPSIKLKLSGGTREVRGSGVKTKFTLGISRVFENPNSPAEVVIDLLDPKNPTINGTTYSHAIELKNPDRELESSTDLALDFDMESKSAEAGFRISTKTSYQAYEMGMDFEGVKATPYAALKGGVKITDDTEVFIGVEFSGETIDLIKTAAVAGTMVAVPFLIELGAAAEFAALLNALRLTVTNPGMLLTGAQALFTLLALKVETEEKQSAPHTAAGAELNVSELAVNLESASEDDRSTKLKAIDAPSLDWSHVSRVRGSSEGAIFDESNGLENIFDASHQPQIFQSEFFLNQK